VSSQQYIAIPECQVITEYKPMPANKAGLKLTWDEHARPENKLWVKSYRQFSSIENQGFQDFNIITTVTTVPSINDKMNPWNAHFRVELSPRKGKPIPTEWTHIAVNFINHPKGNMQTLLLQGGSRCQNSFHTRNPNVMISAVYVYEV
jgi:hypothetical protein